MAAAAARETATRYSELEEKHDAGVRHAARAAEDAAAAAAAAAARDTAGAAAAAEARDEAAAAQSRRDAEHAAECDTLHARHSALTTRADAAERLTEETKAAARVSLREVKEQLADAAAAAAAAAEERHAARAAADAAAGTDVIG